MRLLVPSGPTGSLGREQSSHIKCQGSTVSGIPSGCVFERTCTGGFRFAATAATPGYCVVQAKFVG